MNADAAVVTAFAAERHRRSERVAPWSAAFDPYVSTFQDALDRVTQLAADELDAPMACVSLLDGENRLFMSASGLDAPLALVLTWSFSRHVIGTRRPLVTADARALAVLQSSPAVRDGSVVAYAGVPIVRADGRAVGTLSVMQAAPRAWPRPQIDLLKAMAAAIVAEIEPQATVDLHFTSAR